MISTYKASNDTLFSLISGDAEYAYAAGISTSQYSLTLVSGGETTATGNTFINTLATEGYYNTIYHHKAYDVVIYNTFKKIFPLVDLTLLTGLTSTSRIDTYDVNNNRQIQTAFNTRSGNVNELQGNVFLRYNGSNSTLNFLQGRFSQYNVSTTGNVNLITMQVLVSNAAKTAFIGLRISAFSNTVYCSRTQSIGDNSYYTNYFSNVIPYVEHTDPFHDGGTSEPGGGGGSFDDSTDTITIPSYTAEQLLNRAYGYCGFINVYVTNRNELIQLHNYMFSSLITDTIKKMFADPIECILSLTMLPFTLTSTLESNMIIGTVDTEIPSHIAEQQYVTIDCGYIDLTEYWKSYLDFSPYTKTSIYLPYIGTREIDTDKIMGRRIGVKYVMDIISGSCIAYISAETAYDNESLPAETAPLGVIYQFSGNAAIQVPISSATYGEFYASLISGLVTAGATAASIYTGGMSAPVGVAALSGAALNVANSKPQISASGALPAVTGWLGIQKPYITIERPKQCLPEDQNKFTGYPAFVTLTPGDTSGYTEFEVIHLENIPATDAEKDEITNLMKTGVIL